MFRAVFPRPSTSLCYAQDERFLAPVRAERNPKGEMEEDKI